MNIPTLSPMLLGAEHVWQVAPRVAGYIDTEVASGAVASH